MKLKKCPICNKRYYGQGAISRRDNKTEICNNCGINQAMQDFINFWSTHTDPIGDTIKEIKAD